MFDRKKKILVTGETGFLGKRLVRRLREEGFDFAAGSTKTGLDLRDPRSTEAFFEKERPAVVLHCAAYVGGIKFNAEHEGEIFYNNMLMTAHLFEAARKYGVEKIVNPIANCSYPDVVQKDFKESEWWDGPLHPSVFVYGFARKASWVNAYAYHRQYGMNSVNFLVPNMYGPEDHFDEVRSHAMGALIMKIARAKEENLPEVNVWGTGNPVREWLYVDDFAELMIRALDLDPGIDPINVGEGRGITIRAMAEKIKEIIGYEGELVFDASRPDGAAYKVMNVARMKEVFGWTPPTGLEQGIRQTVEWYYKNILRK